MRFALALVLASFSVVAHAQDADCTGPRTQAEMNVCAARDYKEADVALNAVWPELIAQAKENDSLGMDDGRPGYEEMLRKAQQAWLTFRDANCEYAGYQGRGGTMESKLVSTCLARMTNERTQELRKFLQEFGMQ